MLPNPQGETSAQDMKKWFVGFLGLALAIMFLGMIVEGAQKSLSVQKDESLRRGETRVTLDPSMFKDPQYSGP